MTSGADVIAQSLKNLGVTTVFGIVGIPIVEVFTIMIIGSIECLTNFIDWRFLY